MGDNYGKMFISPIHLQLNSKAVRDTDLKLCMHLGFSGLTYSDMFNSMFVNNVVYV